MYCWLNCVTYAFDIEEELTQRPENLDYCLAPVKAVEEFATKHGRKVRVLSSKDEELHSGEWRIAFFGFIPGGFALEDDGRPTWYNYHLVKELENGVWKHRKTFRSPVKTVDMDEMVSEYTEHGYPPFYFAVSKL